MRSNERFVTTLPLARLWDDGGTLTATRRDYLDRPAVAALLRAGDATLVVAESGRPLEWVPPDRAAAVWQGVRERLVGPAERVEKDGGVRYWASRWDVDGRGPVVLLEARR